MRAAPWARRSAVGGRQSTVWLAAVWLGLVVAHPRLLSLPYFWDEAGYYVPSALDFFRHGWLVPRSTLANGHPPLLSIYLAGAWKLFGFHPVVTRAAMLLVAALALLGVFRLGQRLVGTPAALAGTLLLAVNPLFFAQSSMALLDVPVTAAVVWALYWRGERRDWLCAAILAAACLTKETAAIVPAALIGLDVARRAWRRAGWNLVPLAVLSAWFIWFHHATGHWMGDPQYLAYNVGQAAFSPARIGLALGRRLWQMLGYNGAWLVTAGAAWGWWRSRQKPWMRPEVAALIAVYVIFHAVIGGAVLTRYLLPAMALFSLVLAEGLLRRPRGGWVVAACAAFLVVNWFWLPPYPFAFEDNLAYADFVRLHQAAAAAIEAQGLAGPIATAWPATNELHTPDLGYVKRPHEVVELSDFSQQALRTAPREPVLYLYSRDYQPSFDITQMAGHWRDWNDRIFRHAENLTPENWAAAWHATPVFTAQHHGQWVGVYVAPSPRGGP